MADILPSAGSSPNQQDKIIDLGENIYTTQMILQFIIK